jgi:hypothetical protein
VGSRLGQAIQGTGGSGGGGTRDGPCLRERHSGEHKSPRRPGHHRDLTRFDDHAYSHVLGVKWPPAHSAQAPSRRLPKGYRTGSGRAVLHARDPKSCS